jgi:hypothetical protein
MPTEKKIAYAALDIGTSQLKLGVYCPWLSDSIILINNLSNELIYGSSGAVLADYKLVREKSFALFMQLGVFLKTNKIDEFYLGICGHISSLLEWKKMRPLLLKIHFQHGWTLLVIQALTNIIPSWVMERAKRS